jgi:hypothetical protein
MAVTAWFPRNRVAQRHSVRHLTSRMSEYMGALLVVYASNFAVIFVYQTMLIISTRRTLEIAKECINRRVLAGNLLCFPNGVA